MSSENAQSDRKILSRLLSGAVSGAPASQPAGEADLQAEEYDWNRPYRFTPPQVDKLQERAGLIAEKLSEALAGLFGSEMRIEPVTVSEHYGAGLVGGDEGQANRYVAITGGDGRCGFITLPTQIAIAWVSRLLGGHGGAGEDRGLSDLETELLMDVAGAMIGALSGISGECGGGEFRQDKQVVEDSGELIEDDAVYCRFAFRQSDSEDQPGVWFTVQAEQVAPLAGAEAPRRIGDDEGRQAVMACLQHARIRGEVRLCETSIPLRNVMDLETGDVLLLQNVDDPIRMTVQGTEVLVGRPAQSDGQYAVQVLAVAQGE